MRRLTALLLALLLPASLLAACSDDGDGADGKGADDGGEVAEQDERDGGSREDRTLADLLLTIEDIGGDWTADPPVTGSDDEDDDEGDDLLPECFQRLDDAADAEALADAQVSFTRADGFTGVSESLERYELGDLDASIATSTQILDDCKGITLDLGEDPAGRPLEVEASVERTELPAYGDGTSAWVMRFEADGDQYEFLFALVKMGDLSLTMTYSAINAEALAGILPFLSAAVKKVEAAQAENAQPTTTTTAAAG